MTLGSLIQISVSKKSNNFLEYDPQISYFKVVYRKYTRFAMENIKFDNLNRKKLSDSESVLIKCDVPRHADLLKNVYFTFELPDIYSGASNTKDEVNVNYEFQWIKNIGLNIFKYVELKIGNQTIDKLFSDYINIWKELTLDEDEKQIFNENIGHVKELYDPKNSPGQNGIYPNITTNVSDTNHLKYKYYDNSSKIAPIPLSDYTNILPSIKKRKIKVPLPFSFFLNSGMAIPLIALQYHEISIELKMRKFIDLYTIKDATSGDSFNKRIKPTASNVNITSFTNNYDLDINPNIEGEFIFLDDDERKRFAATPHKYIFEQSALLYDSGYTMNLSSNETSIELTEINGPVKYIAWVIKRDDFENINEWSNYTNWIYPDVPPYSNEYFYKDTYYNNRSATGNDVFYSINKSTHNTDFTINNTEKLVLDKFELKLDGTTRIKKDAEYFNRQQMYQHFKKKPSDGIYTYSFALNPLDNQPSGSCNFNLINKTVANFTKNQMDNTFNHYNFKIYVYCIRYNILNISSGMGSLSYSY